MTRSFFAALVGAIAIVLGSAPSSAQMAYIPNGSGVSVIATAINTVVGTIPVSASGGVTVTPDGSTVYVNNTNGGASVIDIATNTVVGTIPVGAAGSPALSPDGSKLYVTSFNLIVNGVFFCDLAPCLQASMSVIDTTTTTVVGTIPLPIFTALFPFEPPFQRGVVLGIAVSPDGSKVYVSYKEAPDIRFIFTFVGVSVVDTATNTVAGDIFLESGRTDFSSSGMAVSPDGSKLYVAVSGLDLLTFGPEVFVIDFAANNRPPEIPGIEFGLGRVAFTPDSSKLYVVTTNPQDGTSTVLVIDTATSTVIGLPIPVGSSASGGGIEVTPDGSKVYVVGNTATSVIDTATNTVVAVLPVGGNAFGVFIQPRFAGTIGDANCHDDSTSALAQTFRGLNAAAIALGFPTVQTLQTAVNAYCGL
jgi:YVTN family beta-propeller protein